MNAERTGQTRIAKRTALACPRCSGPVRESDRFCMHCGAKLDSGALVSMPVARRIAVRDLPGLFKKTLVVPQGFRALLFVEGKHDATLGPGRYTPGTGAVAVLVASGDIPVAFTLDRLFTSDPLPLKADFRLALQVAEPVLLYTNLLGDAAMYGPEELTAALSDPAGDAAAAFLGQRRAADLQTDMRAELEQEINLHLADTLHRWGLRLAQLQVASFRCEARDKVTGQRTEYALLASEKEASLEGRKRLFDVFTREEVQALAEEISGAEFLEKRVALWERVRRTLVADAGNRLRSEAELETMMRQVDKERLLKDSELQDLKTTLAEAAQDREQARAHLLRKAGLERDFEVRRVELSRRRELTEAELARETALARQELEGRWEVDLKKLDLELEMRRRRAQFDREQGEAREAQERQAQLAQAQTVAAIRGLERGGIEQDLDMALDAYRKLKDIKREDEVARERVALEARWEQQKMDLARLEAEASFRLREAREKAQHEVERIRALSGVDLEVLIAVSGAPQGAMLAELARTRALKDCSPQQILAMQVEKSPQVLEGLKEVMLALSATNQYPQYERLVHELKESARLSREDYQRNLQMVTEMAHKALDSVKETAVAFAGQPRG